MVLRLGVLQCLDSEFLLSLYLVQIFQNYTSQCANVKVISTTIVNFHKTNNFWSIIMNTSMALISYNPDLCLCLFSLEKSIVEIRSIWEMVREIGRVTATPAIPAISAATTLNTLIPMMVYLFALSTYWSISNQSFYTLSSCYHIIIIIYLFWFVSWNKPAQGTRHCWW